MNNRLNIAGRIAETFVSSKLTILFVIACILIGAFALKFTPREENPQIIVPGADVFVTMPGASAEEVEELIVTPLEGILSEIPGVDHTYGMAMNSFGMVTVQFDVGEDKEDSLVKLYDKVFWSRSRLPKDASDPVVKSLDVDDVPIVTLTLSSEEYDDYALKRLADRIMERLRSIEEVSLTYVKGGADREIRVELDPERLQAFGVTLDQIRRMLLSGNIAGPMGSTVKNGKNRSIFMDGFFTSVREVAGLVVGIYNGRPIYLEDVADVIDGPPREREVLSRFAFGPADNRFGKSRDIEMAAVTLAVSKKPGTNAVTVARDIIERVERMRKNLVPEGINLVVTRNDGDKANAAVNLLIEHLGIAIFSVFMIIAFFLGIKEAILISAMIPLVLGLTFGVNFLCGPTINRLTLFGLLLAMGMLVDDAIVVVENIHRHYENIHSGDRRLSAVLATNEIGNPTILATIAIMLVMWSLIVVTGMIGRYFYPIAFTVPVAMFVSLLMAYIVIPWASNRWLVPKALPEKDGGENFLQKTYKRFLKFVLDRPRRCFFLFSTVILLIAVSLLQPAWQFIRPQGAGGALSPGGVSLIFLPKDDKNTFNITIDMPEYTPVEVTDRLAREIGELLRTNKYILNYQTYIGMSGVVDFTGLFRGTGNKKGPHIAEIRVNLIDKIKRYKTSIKIVRDLRPLIENLQKKYPGSVVQLVEDPAGPPVKAMVLAEIYGSDPDVLRKLAGQVKEEFRKTYDIVEVHDSEIEDVPQYRVVIDKEKSALSGINTAQVGNALRRLIDGELLGRVHMPGEKNLVPIKLHVPRKYQIDPVLLAKIFLTNKDGKMVPLSELTKVIISRQDRPIFHKDNEQVAYVGAELAGTSPVYAVLDLDKRLDGLEIENGSRLSTANLKLQSVVPDTIDGYKLLWDGEIRLTLDMFRDLSAALAVALLFIYLLLVGYYKSFILPVIAMAAVPLGIPGIFPGHWLMGQQFTGASMIGAIALAGVVVRNSLLLIDFIIDYLKMGLPLRDAVCEACAVRLRPIFLTSLAVTLGIAIMLTDPVFGGLAITLIFGNIASTILTLATIPVLIYLLFKTKSFKDYAHKDEI
jgi:multidrug efflux pump subunit AcrB